MFSQTYSLRKAGFLILLAIFLVLGDALAQYTAEDTMHKRIEYGKEKDSDIAVTEFTKAIERNPNDAEAYSLRGWGYVIDFDFDRAISDFNKAIEIKPSFAEAYYNRAYAYYKKQEYAKAWDDMQKAEELGYKVDSKFAQEVKKLSQQQSAGYIHIEEPNKLYKPSRLYDKYKKEEEEFAQVRRSLESCNMLEEAAIHGDLNKAAQAIADGANVNGFTGKFNIPLRFAVSYGHKEIVKLLLAHGANVSLRDESSWDDTPLHQACFPGRPAETIKEIAELLIANGADVNARNASGATPLNLLFQAGGDKELAKLLIEKGADINTKDDKGNTPFAGAVASGDKEIIELLIKKGADVNARNEYGETALYRAALLPTKGTEIIELLLSAGADVNARDVDGNTVLLCASMLPNKGPEVIELLLSAGADVNARNNQGKTVLTILEELGSQFHLPPNIRDKITLLKAHGATH